LPLSARAATGGEPGSKIHVLCDRRGIPLAVLISAANTSDAQLMLPLLDSVAPVRSRRGRPRQRPSKVRADKAYDQLALRAEVRRRGHRGARRWQDHRSSQCLGRHRWIVEACLSWLMNNGRLVRRYERKAEHFQAFAYLGCILTCIRPDVLKMRVLQHLGQRRRHPVAASPGRLLAQASAIRQV
jgi:transposase